MAAIIARYIYRQVKGKDSGCSCSSCSQCCDGCHCHDTQN
ncbi:MAG: hypothetical protein J6T38_09125 [Bacteroidaceae bacterium]|nr:hypothetical protein [Bacteroidaceae bacterium]